MALANGIFFVYQFLPQPFLLQGLENWTLIFSVWLWAKEAPLQTALNGSSIAHYSWSSFIPRTSRKSVPCPFSSFYIILRPQGSCFSCRDFYQVHFPCFEKLFASSSSGCLWKENVSNFLTSLINSPRREKFRLGAASKNGAISDLSPGFSKIFFLRGKSYSTPHPFAPVCWVFAACWMMKGRIRIHCCIFSCAHK